MFTGIISDVGAASCENGKLRVTADMDLSDVRTGDSIAVNGVCLTVKIPLPPFLKGEIWFDLGVETMKCTTLGGLKAGQKVHLEKALRFSDRLGGHLIQGHVDGVAHLTERTSTESSVELWFSMGPELIAQCIHKGSIAINGVSLTINAILGQRFSVCLIPHTLEKTCFSEYALGEAVNIEIDLIGKYVRARMQLAN